MKKKDYQKPIIRESREIEALTGDCMVGDGIGSGDQKTAFDPNTGACVAPMT